MSVVAALFVTLFTRLPALASGRSLARQRRFGAAAALLGIGAYTILVGAGPAAARS